MAATKAEKPNRTVAAMEALRVARAGVADLPDAERLAVIEAMLSGIAGSLADLNTLAGNVPDDMAGALHLKQQLRNMEMSRLNALIFSGQAKAALAVQVDGRAEQSVGEAET